MKKLIVAFVLAVLAVAPMFADNEELNGVYPYEKEGWSNENATLEASHWSIYLPVGFTFADMDESKGAKLGSGLSDMTMNMGLGVEYNFTPHWTIGFEFNSANYGKNSFTSTKGDDGTRKDGTSLGVVYNMTALLEYDLMDGFFPKRNQTIFNLYALVGGGYAFYHYQKDGDAAIGSTMKDKDGNPRKFDTAPFLTFGLLADFNLQRNVSLGVRAMYNYYMSDNLDLGMDLSAGGMAGGNTRINSNNDGLFTADIVLHYNFSSEPKSHVRNMARGTETKLEYAAMRAAEEAADGGAGKKPMKDTVVVSHKDTVVMAPAAGAGVAGKDGKDAHASLDAISYVYFDNDKYVLTDQAHMDILEAAHLLMRNPEACLEMTGYCDYMGSDAHNEKLAKNRAKAVRDELVNLYGIDPSRIVDLGRGKLENVKNSFAPNRRVELRVVDRTELEEIRKAKEEEEKGAAAEAKEAPAYKSEEAAMSEMDITWDTTKYVGMEVTKAGTTLSSLAEKYYGNANCWVYIYQANRDVIKTPDYLWTGTKLYMPILSEEEMHASKKAANALMEELKKL